MRTLELVNAIAEAQKNQEAIPQLLLEELGEQVVFIAIQTVRNAEGIVGGKKVRLLTVESGGSKNAFSFAAEDLLFQRFGDDQQFLPLAFADVMEIVSSDVVVELCAGAAAQVFFTPEEFFSLSRIISSPAINRVPKPVVEKDVVESLSSIFEKNTAISEAYFVNVAAGPGGELSGGLLGILLQSTENHNDAWSTEERFTFVEEIAELSRLYYRYAGAIEIYDDLANSATTSWNFFKPQTPIYCRSGEEKQKPFQENATKKTRSGSIISVIPGLRGRVAAK